MKIAVFGVGYVGTVTAAELAWQGHNVIGVEVNPQKVARLQRGRAPFREPGLDTVLAEVVMRGSLRATTDPTEAWGSDCFIVCVGTPSTARGSVDLAATEQVCATIGELLSGSGGYPVVVLRSTVPPPALDRLVELLEMGAGKLAGRDFGFCTNPEFLREGTALADFRAPPMTVIGELDSTSGDVVAELYDQLDAPVIRTTCKTAMLAKYACNAWHALKVTFANEIDVVGRALGVSGDVVMDIVTQDTVLNISRAYMRPGFAYGGSCLPKDLAGLLALVQPAWVPVLAAIPRSNAQRVRGAVDTVLASGAQRVALVGLSFKMGTDDLRGSPYVAVAEALLEAGIQVRIWDPDVPVDRAGQYAGHLTTLGALREWADCWVIGKPAALPEDTVPHRAMVVEVA